MVRKITCINTYKLLVGDGGQISTFGGEPSPPLISCNASISFTNSCCCFCKAWNQCYAQVHLFSYICILNMLSNSYVNTAFIWLLDICYLKSGKWGAPYNQKAKHFLWILFTLSVVLRIHCIYLVGVSLLFKTASMV